MTTTLFPGSKHGEPPAHALARSKGINIPQQPRVELSEGRGALHSPAEHAARDSLALSTHPVCYFFSQSTYITTVFSHTFFFFLSQ